MEKQARLYAEAELQKAKMDNQVCVRVCGAVTEGRKGAGWQACCDALLCWEHLQTGKNPAHAHGALAWSDLWSFLFRASLQWWLCATTGAAEGQDGQGGGDGGHQGKVAGAAGRGDPRTQPGEGGKRGAAAAAGAGGPGPPLPPCSAASATVEPVPACLPSIQASSSA